MDGLTYKGIPLGVELDPDDFGSGRLDVRAGDLATPAATLSLPAITANAIAMRNFCATHGVHLAPHAKTTLAAGLIALQQSHGAWALTAALPRQVALLWRDGFPRVLLANEVTDPTALAWLAAGLAEQPDRRLWLYVDSARGLELLAEAARRNGSPQHPFDVLVELGHDGGRTGCRSGVDAVALAERVGNSPGLRLAGVAGYEGTIGSLRTPEVVAAVDAFLDELRELADRVLDAGLVEQPVVTAGGSLFFDRVTARLSGWARDRGATVVLRSGCYLIHDHGLYADGTPAAAGVPDAPVLRAALSVWARVVSAPEPGLALVDAGRRDLSHDAGLPVPLERVRGRDSVDLQAAGAHIDALSDQHAFVRVPLGLDIAPGDLVRLGISHPCTTLDRHRALFLVDEADHVVGVSRTNF